MKIYAVSREGAFRHEIMGLYDDAEVAITRACNCAKAEKDDYHEFYVLWFIVNMDVFDGEVVAIIRRNHGAISINRMVPEE